MAVRRHVASLVWSLVLGLVACGDDAGMAPTTSGLQSIAIMPPAPTVPNGLTTQLSAIGVYADGTTADLSSQVVWLASPSNTATVTQRGLLSGEGVGNATLVAQLGDRRALASAIVTPAIVVALTVAAEADHMPAGIRQQLVVSGVFSDGAVAPITSEVTWMSSAPEHVEMLPSGVARAVTPGTARIMAATGGLTSQPVTIEATDVALTTFDLRIGRTSTSVRILPGARVALQARGSYADGSVYDVTPDTSWEVNSAGVAEVTPDGVVIPVSFGTTLIFGVFRGPGVGGSAVFVEVLDETLASIEVTPASLPIAVGLNQRFSATGTMTNGTPVDITEQVTWESSDPEVATISNARGNQGVAHTRGQGTSILTARLGGVSQFATLTVFMPGPR